MASNFLQPFNRKKEMKLNLTKIEISLREFSYIAANL